MTEQFPPPLPVLVKLKRRTESEMQAYYAGMRACAKLANSCDNLAELLTRIDLMEQAAMRAAEKSYV